MKLVFLLLWESMSKRRFILILIFATAWVDGIFFYATTWLISKFLEMKLELSAFIFLIYFVGIFFFNLCTSYLIRRWGEYLALSSSESVKTYFLQKILTFSDVVSLPHSGLLLSLVQKISDIYPQIIFQIYWWFCRAVIVFTALFYLIYQNSKIVFGVDLLLILLFIVFSQYLSKKILPFNLDLNQSRGEYLAVFSDLLQNLTSIKVLHIENFVNEKIIQKQTKVSEKIHAQQVFHAWRWFMLHAIFGIILVGSMLMFFVQSQKGLVETSLYIVIVSFFVHLRSDLNNLAENLKLLTEQSGYLDQLTPYMFPKGVSHVKTEKKSNIYLQNITLIHPQAHFKLYIEDFRLDKGERVLLNGRSGEGKSTFLKFLSGLYDWPIESNSLISTDNTVYFGQEVELFNMSFLENITFGSKSNDKELHELINLVGLSSLIKQQNNTLDFIISEKGKNLSTGQKTRINLLRAYFCKQDITLFDEPFAHLDLENIKLVSQFIKNYLSHKTILIVSHNQNNLPNYFSQTYAIKGGVLKKMNTSLA